ncbi:hypothetical protein J6590_079890 [Homalodisca vitripennis]|nr:hypothetical protein J6590_079890 [Homalodisca vitripennis]
MAVSVIAGVLHIEILAEGRRTLHRRRGSSLLTAEERKLTLAEGLYENSLKYSTCSGVDEYENEFFGCSRFQVQREQLDATSPLRTGSRGASETVWKKTSSFVTDVLTELRRKERKRTKLRNRMECGTSDFAIVRTREIRCPSTSN